MKKRDIVEVIIGLLTIFAMLFGAYQFFDRRYASAQETKQSIQQIQQTQQKESKRLDYKILSDQLKAIRDRIWQLQDRLEKSSKAKLDKTIQEDLKSLEANKEDTQKKLDALEKEIR